MDKFRKLQDKKAGIGGVNCACCNDFRGKDKPKLNRSVRRILKQQDDEEIKEILDENHSE